MYIDSNKTNNSIVCIMMLSLMLSITSTVNHINVTTSCKY